MVIPLGISRVIPLEKAHLYLTGGLDAVGQGVCGGGGSQDYLSRLGALNGPSIC